MINQQTGLKLISKTYSARLCSLGYILNIALAAQQQAYKKNEFHKVQALLAKHNF